MLSGRFTPEGDHRFWIRPKTSDGFLEVPDQVLYTRHLLKNGDLLPGMQPGKNGGVRSPGKRDMQYARFICEILHSYLIFFTLPENQQESGIGSARCALTMDP
jgi:hypothetical protein